MRGEVSGCKSFVMRHRSTVITGTLTAAVAFAGAFLISRHGGGESRGTARVSETAAESTPGPGKTQKTAGGRAGWQDPLLLRALANADLAVAVKEIMDHSDEDHCADTRLICLVENLPAARLSELTTVLDASVSNDYIVRFILGSWAQRDPAAALAWVQAHPALNDSGVHSFLRGWTHAAPDAALAWVDAQPLSAASAGLREAAVAALSEKDPAAALALLKSRGWLASSPRALVQLLQNWGGSDPAGALAGFRGLLEEMKAIPSADPRSSQTFHILLGALLNGAYDRNPADAAGLLSQFTPAEIAVGSEAIAQEILARDPATADPLFTPHPDANTRALLKALMAKNPGTVLGSLDRILDRELQTELLTKLGDPFSQGIAVVPAASRAAIEGLLPSIPEEGGRRFATERLCRDNARSAPEWSATLWRQLPAAQQANDGQGFFIAQAQGSPGVAVETFHASPPEVQARAFDGLITGLAISAPQEGLRLVLANSDVAARTEAAGRLYAFWWKAAPDAADAALHQSAAQLDLRSLLNAMEKHSNYLASAPGQYDWAYTAAPAAAIRKLLGEPPAPAP